MGISIGRGHAVIALWLLAACSNEQAWEFRSGVELPASEPARIVASATASGRITNTAIAISAADRQSSNSN